MGCESLMTFSLLFFLRALLLWLWMDKIIFSLGKFAIGRNQIDFEEYRVRKKWFINLHT